MTERTVVGDAEGASTTADIYRQFRGLIVSGRLAADERLPTVRQTARDLGVAAGTAAKAYRMLEQDGLVVSRTAAGTRVAASAAVLPLPVMRRIRELVDAAQEAGSDPADVLSVLRVVWTDAGEAPGDHGG